MTLREMWHGWQVQQMDVSLRTPTELGKTARGLAELRKITLSVGPSALNVEGAPRVELLDVRNGSLAAADRDALRVALPDCEMVFEPPIYKKRKRTAPKRKLGKSDWKHARPGYEPLSYALLIAGRRYAEDLALMKAKELGVIAEAWSQQLGEHVAAVMPYDLSPSGGLAGADAASPIVIGRVVAMVDADQGPSAAIAASMLEDAQQRPLPGVHPRTPRRENFRDVPGASPAPEGGLGGALAYGPSTHLGQHSVVHLTCKHSARSSKTFNPPGWASRQVVTQSGPVQLALHSRVR